MSQPNWLESGLPQPEVGVIPWEGMESELNYTSDGMRVIRPSHGELTQRRVDVTVGTERTGGPAYSRYLRPLGLAGIPHHPKASYYLGLTPREWLALLP